MATLFTGPATAQAPEAVPDVTAVAWPQPIGDYLPLHVIMTDARMAHRYDEGSRVKSGS